jgi:hypothetical protein
VRGDGGHFFSHYRAGQKRGFFSLYQTVLIEGKIRLLSEPLPVHGARPKEEAECKTTG